jgi:hypothetical protein
MKETKNIDEFFNSKIGEPTTPYSAKDWAAMESMLKADEKGVVFFFRKHAALLALLGLTCILGIWGLSSLNSQKGSTQPVSLESEVNADKTLVIDNNTAKSSLFDENEVGNTENPRQVEQDAASVLPTALKDKTDFKDNFIGIPVKERKPLVIPDSIKLPTEKEVFYSVEKEIPEPIYLDSKDVSLFNVKLSPEPLDLKMKFSPRKWSLYINPSVIYNFYARTKPNEHLRQNQEKPLSSISSGLNLELQRGNFLIRTGVGNTVLREETNYSVESYTSTKTYHYVMIDPNFTTSRSGKDLGLVERRETETIDTAVSLACANCETKFKYIDVPVSIQYRQSYNRWTVYAELGVQWSMLQKTQGSYSNYATMSEPSGELDVTPVLFQTKLSAGMLYDLNSNFSVSGDFGIRRSTNSMMQNYQQKPQILGLGIGLHYKLY